MTYFNQCNSLEELKIEYRKLCIKNHPDNGGNIKIMQEINAEYDKVFNKLKNIHNKKVDEDTTGRTRKMSETPEQFRDIISKIINLKNITVELCGMWIWISGETKQHKDILKALGFRWARKKGMWYWRNEQDSVISHGKVSMAEIRKKYGSDKIEDDNNKKLLYRTKTN